MSSSVGRNSLIMACGTAASRVTGQIRTILLAAALGTTGMAANAYQAGSMIPQAIFTLVSGGIFNAVLVPQIVRTLKQKDSEERLNKLITLAIALLAGMTALMALATPLLTRLYVGGDARMMALTQSFMLWCMPQIFFYGLYTVLGQILAAKNRFGVYAWSSVGANIVSCAGFATFILLFGKANEQPLEFWTPSRLALTAGTWTAGVAFQALVLFVPLMRIGLHYRPRFGLHGFGLKHMGPVAAWSLGVVAIGELSNIVITRVMTSAPQHAHDLSGTALSQTAGNATYQNAYTLLMLPYSLIAVSVATAIFPKISAAIADRDIDAAREDLSSSVRTIWLLMVFFAAALIAFPEPIIVALLPSVSMAEAVLIARVLTFLAIGLPLSSLYLIFQRTFYAFEDGKHPFVFALLQQGAMAVLAVLFAVVTPAEHWTTLVGVAVSLSYVLGFPVLVQMMRRRFGGNIGGRALTATLGKGLLAAVAAGLVAIILREPIAGLLGADLKTAGTGGETMNWPQALGICVALTIVMTVVYAVVLWALRTRELTDGIAAVRARLGRGNIQAPQEDTTDGQKSAESTMVSAIPTTRMSTESHLSRESLRYGVEGNMNLQLGDTVINRYTLVSSLREEPGLTAWKANDSVLAHDCQLFVVTNPAILQQVNDTASSLALSKDPRFADVLQLEHVGDVAIVVTELDPGISLREYMADPARTLTYDAMRSIIGDAAVGTRALLADGLAHHAISCDTVRIARRGLELADGPVSAALVEPTAAPEHVTGEPLMIRQLASVLYSMLTHEVHEPGAGYDLNRLPGDMPGEFRMIVKRGLDLHEGDDGSQPLVSVDELIALLGWWAAVQDLGDDKISRPSKDGECSIVTVAVAPVDQNHLLSMPEGIVTSGSQGFDFSVQPLDIPDGVRQTLPIDVSAVRTPHTLIEEPSEGETTSPMPAVDMGLTPSERALREEERAIAAAGDAGLPPSFTPTAAPVEDTGTPLDLKAPLNEDEDYSEVPLFGRMTTKVVAIVVGLVVVVAAAGLAVHSLTAAPDNVGGTVSANSENDWPETDLSDVPFGDTAEDDSEAKGDSGDGTTKDSAAKDKDATEGKDTDAKAKDKKSDKQDTAKAVVHADKQVKQVPQPQHVNNTPLDIASQNFLDNPAGQAGYGYALHLAEPQQVYRLIVSIRTSGGKGYVIANSATDPNQGQRVAEFTFDPSGTTEVKFNQVVTSQDVLIWVPADSLPGNQLYINSVQLF